MSTILQRKIIGLLKGGHALSEPKRRALINKLAAEERKFLRNIALGKIDVPHAKLRSKAITALAFDESEPEESLGTLRSLLETDDPLIQIRTLRSLGRLNAAAVNQKVRQLVNDPSIRPAVALAAARVAAKVGGDEIARELRSLRERLIGVFGSEKSISIISLDHLIARAEERKEPESDKEPKLIV